MRAHVPAAHVAAVAWRLARYQPRWFATGATAWVTWWTLPALVGLLLQAVFDRIAGGAPATAGIVGLLALLVAVEGTRVVIFYTTILLWVRWWTHAEALLRSNMLRAQLASGGPEAGPRVAGAGTAIAVFRDDVRDLVVFLDTWLDLGGTLLFATVALVVMVQVDATVTLVVAVPLALAYVVTRLLTDRLRAYRHADREATGRVTGFLGNLFSAVLAVKVAGAEDAAVRRLRVLNAGRRRTALRDRLLADSLEAFSSSTVDLSIGLVLLLVAPAMRRGAFTVGDLALFASYLAALAGLPRWAGRFLTRHRHAQVAVGRMGALMPRADADAVVTHRSLALDGREPASGRSRPTSLAPAAVVVRGLSHRFPAGAGIAHIDLDLPPGSFTVVCGPVGSGKSTLLRALLGLVTPVTGQVRWNGEVIEDLSAHMTPPRCAYLAQVPRLFSATLRDNLTLGRDTPDDELALAVRRAALDPDVARMGQGLDTLVGPRGVRLSGGQIQRAATARALASDPALLVLDDLSSALDADTERRLWDRLREGRTPTCLVVSHRAAALERADRIVLLEAGRIRAAGTLAELRTRGLDPLAGTSAGDPTSRE